MPDPQSPQLPSLNGKVVSHIPGRMRVRLHRDHRHPERMKTAQETLSSVEGVTGVETNPLSGSILVHYDAGKLSNDAAKNMLSQANVNTGAAAPDLSEPDLGDIAGTMMKILNVFDKWFYKVTGLKIDLRVLVPIGLLAIGIAVAAMEGGLGLSQIPAYIILWVAFEAFIQLYRSKHERAKVDTSSPAQNVLAAS